MTVTASAPSTSNSADGLARRRRADVAALRVGHERDVGRDERAEPLERGDPRRRRSASKNARFGLTAAACGSGRLEQQPRERLDAGERRPGSPAGRAVGSGSMPRHRHRPRRRGPRGEPLEVGGVTSRARTGSPASGTARASGRRGAGPRARTSRLRGAVEAGVRGQVERLLRPSTSGPLPSSWASRRSTIWPAMWRKAIASPAGDHVGAQLTPSSVSRSELRAVRAR